MKSPRGVITPILTPLTDDGALDVTGLGNMIETQIAAKVHALFVSGTTGEGMALSSPLCAELIQAAGEASGHRIQLIVDVGAACLSDAVELAAAAETAGACAVALQPPAYFPLEPCDLLAFYHEFLARTQVPLILYHIPSFTKGIPLAVVAQLARHPRVIGIKDSCGDPEYLACLLDRHQSPDFFVALGDELRFAEGLRQGIDGTVPSSANVDPELHVALVDAGFAEDWPRTQALQDQLTARVVLGRRLPWAQMIRAMKQELVERGVIASDRMSDLFSQATVPRLTEVV